MSNLFFLVLTCSSLVSNLAYDATRLLILNEHLCIKKIIHFSCVHNVSLSFCLFVNNTITRAHLALLGILKVPMIHKTTTLKIIHQTLIILLEWVMKNGKKKI